MQREKFEKCSLDNYLEYNWEVEQHLTTITDGRKETTPYKQMMEAIQTANSNIPRSAPKRQNRKCQSG